MVFQNTTKSKIYFSVVSLAIDTVVCHGNNHLDKEYDFLKRDSFL